MSLRVWLPLCGDLRNNGLEDLTVTNNGATVDNAGKLGKCYAFSGNEQYLEFDKALGPFYNNDFSYAVWLKPTEAKRGIIISEYSAAGSGNVSFELTATLRIRLWWNGSPDIQPTNTLPVNQWSHVVITKTAEQAKFYVNGTLIYTHTQSGGFSTRTSTAKIRVGDDYRSGTIVDYKGSMNDLRIYDHALSVKEIKELAKGLVVHYPLNNNGMGVPNMVDNSLDFTGWTAANGWTKSVSDDGSYMYSYSRTGATTNNWQRLIPTLRVDGNNYPNGVTVSFDLYTPDVSAINHKCLGALQIYQENGTRIGWIEPTWDLSNVESGKWTRISKFFSQAHMMQIYTSGAVYSYTQFSFQLVQNGDISIRKIKIEAGDKTTPYTLSMADVNDTTIYDTSGYNNHSTAVGSPTITDGSVRNSNCMHFIKNQYLIGQQTVNNYLPKDAITVSLWVKCSTWDRPISCTQSGGWSIKQGTNGILFYVYVNGTGYVSQESTTTVAQILNDWHLITGTFDGISVKLYIDGELESTASVSSTSVIQYASNYLCIAAEASATGMETSLYVGDISDVRIYATALSADDIKALYQVSASVDNKKNYYCYEISESDSNLDINKGGVTSFSNIIENDLIDRDFQIGKQVNPNLLDNNIDCVVTYSSSVKKTGYTSIPAEFITAHVGESLTLSYDVSAEGDRYSDEMGQTAYNYVRFGIHGSMTGINASGTSQTTYPFTNYLQYSGGPKRAVMTWEIPTGWQQYGNLTLGVQPFDKPASTNKSTWFLRNVKIELSNHATPYVKYGYAVGNENYILSQEFKEI